ncbi:hypothetical protein BGL51_07650 [Streptococcus thermophilus]|nr:hypothetical protein BGL51_07650 [Streptococcus thermophilus]PJH79996.1 hypothetical protein CV716_00580 [Streptococcus thermophilus]
MTSITPNYITNRASFCLGDEFVTMVDERIRHDKEKNQSVSLTKRKTEEVTAKVLKNLKLAL